eukprot:5485691-Alexandrium_andersonii.AAC.1
MRSCPSSVVHVAEPDYRRRCRGAWLKCPEHHRSPPSARRAPGTRPVFTSHWALAHPMPQHCAHRGSKL